MSISYACDSYVREIESIKDELKRLTLKAKLLRDQKKKAEDNLYLAMDKLGLEEFKSIKRDKIKPKIRQKRKSSKVVTSETLDMLRLAGIADYENFYNKLKNIKNIENNLDV